MSATYGDIRNTSQPTAGLVGVVNEGFLEEKAFKGLW